ncbi:hypothetical protein VIC_003819 [Vibrio coralliilyticus ATCC BAA-450]|nr:hypothetical protein VIC_003819 [Vibrio coralliilyticus ATCC BAA-450]
MKFLIEQEVLLQQYETRQNEHEVMRLLHPDFVKWVAQAEALICSLY